MMRGMVIYILVISMLIPLAACTLDTSPYDSLLSELSQKQSQLRTASMGLDLDAVARLRAEVASLEAKLKSPEMVFIPRYHLSESALNESRYLVDEMKGEFSEGLLQSTEDRISEVESLGKKLLVAEEAYDSGDYAAALSNLSAIDAQIIRMPENLAISAAETAAIEKRGSPGTPPPSRSKLAMLEDARMAFLRASGFYNQFSGDYPPQGDYATAEESLAKGHVESKRAFLLLSQSKGEMFPDDLKLALILGPILLIAALLIYFKMQFKRMSVISALSKTEIPPNSPAEIDRRITILNPENETVVMTVIDRIPGQLEASEFLIEPTVSPRGLLWEIEMDAGRRMTLVYTLKTKGLPTGSSLEIPAPSVMYEVGGRQKKLLGKANKIRVLNR